LLLLPVEASLNNSEFLSVVMAEIRMLVQSESRDDIRFDHLPTKMQMMHLIF